MLFKFYVQILIFKRISFGRKLWAVPVPRDGPTQWGFPGGGERK
jgi:hypothetical protein